MATTIQDLLSALRTRSGNPSLGGVGLQDTKPNVGALGRSFSPIGATPSDEEEQQLLAQASSPVGGQQFTLPSPPKVMGVMPKPTPLLAGPNARIGGLGRAGFAGQAGPLLGGMPEVGRITQPSEPDRVPPVSTPMPQPSPAPTLAPPPPSPISPQLPPNLTNPPTFPGAPLTPPEFNSSPTMGGSPGPSGPPGGPSGPVGPAGPPAPEFSVVLPGDLLDLLERL